MPKVEARITLGNLITIGVLLVSVAVAWGTANAEINQVQGEIADHESRLRILESRVIEGLSRIDQRLSNLEAGQ